MDSAWSLGHFENRGIVYDSMDELSQFTGAPRALVDNEARLMDYADVVFTGGYELSLKKKQRHDNVHFFGCGVEFEHFGKARDPTTADPARHRLHEPPDPRLVRRGRRARRLRHGRRDGPACGRTGRSRWSARS